MVNGNHDFLETNFEKNRQHCNIAEKYRNRTWSCSVL